MQSMGDYKIQRLLGRGGSARVFLARKSSTNQEVALKVFHPSVWDAELCTATLVRAKTELTAISQLKHPNIVSLVEALLDQEPPAVAMQYVEGESLEDFQRQLPYILPEVAVLIVVEILRAIEHAHQQGIVHRDLKPANVIVSKEGLVFVTDFGLAKITDQSRLTATGTVLGSPDYMSPEQARGDVVGPSTDLYSIAAILYFLVTGTKPFSRHSPLSTLSAVIEGKLEAPQKRNPKLSAHLSKIIQKGMSLDPGHRFVSPKDFLQELEDYLKDLGLVPEVFSLPLWLQNPNQETLSALNRMAEQLISRADLLLLRFEEKGVLEAVSHLSVVAPESGALPRIVKDLQQMKQNRHRRLWLWRVLPIASLFLTFIFIGLRKTESPAQVLQQSERQYHNVAPSVASSKKRVTRVAPAVAPTPSLQNWGIVRFQVAKGVRVFWNGSPIDPQNELRQLVGKYQVRFDREGKPSIKGEVEVSSKEPTVIRVQ